eukprot:105108-Chlamydomonas_euryale.AAC.2
MCAETLPRTDEPKSRGAATRPRLETLCSTSGGTEKRREPAVHRPQSTLKPAVHTQARGGWASSPKAGYAKRKALDSHCPMRSQRKGD